MFGALPFTAFGTDDGWLFGEFAVGAEKPGVAPLTYPVSLFLKLLCIVVAAPHWNTSESAAKSEKNVICPGKSESRFLGRLTTFSFALTSISFASRFLSICDARATTSGGSPAIAPTWIPKLFSATPGAMRLRKTTREPSSFTFTV